MSSRPIDDKLLSSQYIGGETIFLLSHVVRFVPDSPTEMQRCCCGGRINNKMSRHESWAKPFCPEEQPIKRGCRGHWKPRIRASRVEPPPDQKNASEGSDQCESPIGESHSDGTPQAKSAGARKHPERRSCGLGDKHLSPTPRVSVRGCWSRW